MKNSIPLITVIIPTFNRAGLLANCLKSLAFLDFSLEKLEIIIIDDASVDETEKIVNLFKNRFHYIIYQKNNENQGVSFSRNKGLSLARGKFIVFLDDDCFVSPDWLKAILGTFSAYPGVSAVGGSVNCTPKSAFAQAGYLSEFSSWLPGGGIRKINNIPACNAAYRASEIKNCYFEQGLQPFEDSLFNYRLVLAKKKIIFNPCIKVFHQKGENFFLNQFIHSQEKYAVAFLQGGYKVFGQKGKILRYFSWLNLFCWRLSLIGFRCLYFGFFSLFLRRFYFILLAEWIRGKTIVRLAGRVKELKVAGL
jgi:glycosyltransferase involved in cell wall biosynthesis